MGTVVGACVEGLVGVGDLCLEEVARAGDEVGLVDLAEFVDRIARDAGGLEKG